VLLRLTYLGLTNTFALLQLLPMRDRDKDKDKDPAGNGCTMDHCPTANTNSGHCRATADCSPHRANTDHLGGLTRSLRFLSG
jgi:hypothetical protein